MKLTLDVKENKVEFLLELLKNFSFVKVDKKNSKNEILKSIEQGLKEVKLVEQGKLKSRSAKSFLNEL